MEQAQADSARRSKSKRQHFDEVDTPMRLLALEDVIRLTRLSEQTIRRMVSAGEFPPPILIPPTSRRPEHRWRLKDYEDWARGQMTLNKCA